MRRQILLWDIKRHKSLNITMKISIKGFKKLRPVAWKTGCRVKIINKVGMPFILRKYRKRKTFVAGALLFVAALYAMTSFIWSVEITGNRELNADQLQNALSEYGIRPGVLKYGIDTDKAVEDMMLNVKKLSWISIDVRGTKVKVQVRERIDPPEIVPGNVPCDIIATKDGFIEKIIVTDGIEAVNEGESVKKGQVLISGQIPVKGEEDEFRLVHAMGNVRARTWYEETCPVKKQLTEIIRTGRMIENRTLVLFNFGINLFPKKIDFEEYDMLTSEKKLSIGDDLVFPFELRTDTYYENRLVQAELGEEDAKAAAVKEAYTNVMKRIPPEAEILKNSVKFTDEDNGYMARVTVECMEDIGMIQEMGGN